MRILIPPDEVVELTLVEVPYPWDLNFFIYFFLLLSFCNQKKYRSFSTTSPPSFFSPRRIWKNFPQKQNTLLYFFMPTTSLQTLPNSHHSFHFRMEESNSPKDPNPLNWDYLGTDLTELIFSHLPIKSIARAAAVCKLWHSIISTTSFSARFSAAKKPWFFLFGQNNIFVKNNQAFAFDPESNEWIKLPTSLFPFPPSQQESSFTGSGG